MKTLAKSGVLTDIRVEDIDTLEMMFSKLTENGWVVPNWVLELRRANDSLYQTTSPAHLT